MQKEEIKKSIKDVITHVLKHDKFTLEDDLAAHDVEGWDSLSHMSIISGIESRFGIKFRLKELNKMKNMKFLVDLVETKLQEL